MNEHFVSIKVDREERPDVDHIYMNAVQMLTGRGGWPMTVFLTPDGKPFYGGTYFPPQDRHGLPGFRRVLLAIAQAYRDKPRRRAEDRRAADGRPAAHAKRRSRRASRSTPSAGHAMPPPSCRGAYDETHGGIGQAPKFPNEAVFELFLRAYAQQRRSSATSTWSLHTLRQMARGGIYDQLGGGFHRYSVDERWLVPHFEKMLYDNAQLVPLYLSAYQLTGDRFFADIARETLDYVVARDARSRRRLLLDAGRRQRRRGGQVLPVGRRRGAPHSRRRRSGGCLPLLGRHRAPATSSTATSCTSRSRSSSSPSCSAATSTRVAPAAGRQRAPSCSRRASSASSRASTTRCSRRGTR